MSELSTIARPYAKAVFELAEKDGNYAKWSDSLALLSAVVADENLQALVEDPFADKAKITEVITGVCGEQIDDQMRNLIGVLVENSRLGAVSEITSRFESLRAEAEAVLEVQVETALPMDDAQQAKLAASLESRFGKKIKLDTRINEALMGGIIIRAGDTVIDGSVRSKLEKLASTIRA